MVYYGAGYERERIENAEIPVLRDSGDSGGPAGLFQPNAYPGADGYPRADADARAHLDADSDADAGSHRHPHADGHSNAH